ncbi:MAG: iron-containing alcohol dehydrogenase [Defluviitaleaceae bacterium]|nr:iron-containing alcohol dehydrogenase [Defluviitaleaceae bacterium]
MYRIYCRVYQFFSRFAFAFAKRKQPKRIENIKALVELFTESGVRSALLATEAEITGEGLHMGLVRSVKRAGIRCAIYGRTGPGPNGEGANDAFEVYKKNDCKAILAIGSGNTLALANEVAKRAAEWGRNTGAGDKKSGAESGSPFIVYVPRLKSGSWTLANAGPASRDADYFMLYPRFAESLQPIDAACAGMEALCLAIEAYLSGGVDGKTRREMVRAIDMIHWNLCAACFDPNDLVSRGKLQEAAYLACAAFWRGRLGYAFAAADAVSSKYGVNRGMACSVLIARTLSHYGARAEQMIAELSVKTGITDKNELDCVKAEKYLIAIRRLAKKTGLPNHIAEIAGEDANALARTAADSINPRCFVPAVLTAEDIAAILREASVKYEPAFLI